MDWEYIKKQGPLVALLLGIAWILYNKIEKLEGDIQICNDQKFNAVVSLTQQTNKALDQNTIALERNTEVIENIQAYLGLGSSIHAKKRTVPLTAREGINHK